MTSPTAAELIRIIESQLQETATAVPDPEHGPHVMAVDGLVDVGAIVGLVLEQAAHIVDTYRVPAKPPLAGFGRTLAALPYETRNHLNALAKEARA